MNFKENLPEGCPWDGCRETSEIFTYRLIKEEKAKELDFFCHYNLYPERRNSFQREPKSHCMSLGLSLFTTKVQAENAMKLPYMKSKFEGVIRLKLDGHSGKISDPDEKGHLTWWIFDKINPLDLIIEEDET
jgi:hypothetical protein